MGGMGEVEQVPVGADDRCGEAPVWDARRGRLLWVDISGATVYEWAPGNRSKQSVSRGLPVSGIALNRDGRLVLAGATGLHVWSGPKDHPHGGIRVKKLPAVAEAIGRDVENAHH